MTTIVNYDSYVMSSTNQITGMRMGGRGGASIIATYTDGTEWVILNRKDTIDRFCGFLYLQNALKDVGHLKAAPNKMAIHNKKIIYLSRYCGEKRLDMEATFKYSDQLSTLVNEIGFTDTLGQANLREQGDTIYIFDTEKTSFNKKVHEKINSFIQAHDLIRSFLEERLKKSDEKEKT